MNAVRVALVLKPFKDFITAYDKMNSYRPDNEKEYNISMEGMVNLTFYDVRKAADMFDALIRE